MSEEVVADRIFDLMVLGAGPAGLTAGLYAHRAGLDVVILGGSSPGGKVMMHPFIENYPPFPGGVTGTELMIRWVKQVSDELGEGPVFEEAEGVALSGEVKRVRTASGEYLGRSVILATGARPKRLGVPGETELEGKGVFSCALCDAPMLRTLERQRTLVVGGGDTAVHTAIGLLPHAETVTLVTRGAGLRAQSALVRRIEREEKSVFIFDRTVVAIEGEDWVTGVRLVQGDTGPSETIPVEGVFVGIGQVPATEFLEGVLDLDPEGFIKTDERLRTSLTGVFAAGDVRTSPLRQIVTAAADGAMAASGAADYVAGLRG